MELKTLVQEAKTPGQGQGQEQDGMAAWTVGLAGGGTEMCRGPPWSQGVT